MLIIILFSFSRKLCNSFFSLKNKTLVCSVYSCMYLERKVIIQLTWESKVKINIINWIYLLQLELNLGFFQTTLIERFEIKVWKFVGNFKICFIKAQILEVILRIVNWDLKVHKLDYALKLRNYYFGVTIFEIKFRLD